MKHWKKYTGLTTICVALGASGLSTPQTAQAQNATTATTENRFFVELKSAALYDALEMLFEAGGNEARSIHPAAKGVYVGTFVRNNVDWYNAVLQLARDHNFRVYRDNARTVHIEPRVPVVEENPGGFPPAANPGQRQPARPGGRPAFGPGGVPWDEFMRNMSYDSQEPTLNLANAEVGDGIVDSGIRTIIRSNAQTRPTFGGGSGGTGGAPRGASAPNAQYYLVPMKHVYVGGIAQLFRGNVGIISTEQFIVPAGTGGQGGQGGRGGSGITGTRGRTGGFGGGTGGFGGGTGGFGGTTGGFGGTTGGFGGNTGGFGGNTGGFGGNTGGFGGGIGGFGR